MHGALSTRRTTSWKETQYGRLDLIYLIVWSGGSIGGTDRWRESESAPAAVYILVGLAASSLRALCALLAYAMWLS
jgi:hypothetical protein